MRAIWALGKPVTVRDVLGDLQAERPLAYTTVMTVMGNLRRKGWLRRQDEGRAYQLGIDHRRVRPRHSPRMTFRSLTPDTPAACLLEDTPSGGEPRRRSLTLPAT